MMFNFLKFHCKSNEISLFLCVEKTKYWGLNRKKRTFPVYLQILAGLCAGVIVGLIALSLNGQQVITDWVKPWGQVFIRLLQLVAVPLVFISLVKGVIDLTDTSRLSKLGIKTIGLYLFTTLVAILIGVSLALVVKPGNFYDSGPINRIDESINQTVSELLEEKTKKDAPLYFLLELVPDNLFAAASDNRKMLQIIFFALLFGIAALTVGKKNVQPLLKLLNSLYAVILKMIDFVIKTAPFGVMALMAGLVTDSAGNMSLFSALAVYAITVLAALLIIIFGFYSLLVRLFSKISVKRYLKEMYPAQLVAFTTSSSAATMPVTMDVAKNRLKLPEEVCSFILPIGTTVNMDGTSCFQSVSVIFIAQVLGLDLSIGQLLTIIFMTTLSSIGTPSIPGGSYVVMTMVLSSVGIPAHGLALVLGIDRPLDMVRTAVNVTGDVAVCSVVAASLPEKQHENTHNS